MSDYEEPPIFYIGHHESKRSYVVTPEILYHAQDHNYDFLTAPITTDYFHSRVLSTLSGYKRSIEEALSFKGTSGRRSTPPLPTISSLRPPDTPLTPNGVIAQLILTTSSWIDLASSDQAIAHISHQVLRHEVQYASFCGAQNILVQGPRLSSRANLGVYARTIQEALSSAPFVHFQILFSMVGDEEPDMCTDTGELSDHASVCEGVTDSISSTSDVFASWEAWNFIRSFCKYNSRLSVALAVPSKLPAKEILSRWFSEPLRAILIPAKTFQISNQGRPTLSQPKRRFIERFMRLRTIPWIILSNISPLPSMSKFGDTGLSLDRSLPEIEQTSQQAVDPTPAEASNSDSSIHAGRLQTSLYLDHIRNIQYNQKPKDAIESYGAGYQDYLQNPLQPLTDNLESITYEVFEKDPIKYDWYQRAITRALIDWKASNKPTSGRNGKVIIAVVGAGRGPLISKALHASEESGVAIDVWGLEKNANAFVLLQRRNVEKWHSRVNLVHSDMRSWRGPFYAGVNGNLDYKYIDILVSELLGSFGDNELSPECLDGVQHLLQPEHGISIPRSYTAHLSPISSPKLYTDTQARISAGAADASEIPYVVMLHAMDFLSVQNSAKDIGRGVADRESTAIPIVEQAWEFRHPIPQSHLQRSTNGTEGTMGNGNEHNQRHAHLEFTCANRGVCHGLAGYFETVLYDPGSSQVRSSDLASAATKSENKANGNSATSRKVELSTNPVTMDEKSKDMISWFPIFFPLKKPVYVPDNSVICVDIWRQTDGRKVWYEWIVDVFMSIGVGSKNSQKIRTSSSELHSSHENACLM